MKKVLFPACVIAVITFSACGGTTQRDTANSAVQPMTFPNTPAANSTKNIFLDTTKGGVSTNSQTTLPAVPVGPKAGTSTAAINPAHGQPNHRCDIAVGAPLNSPSQQQTAPATQTVPVQPSLPTNTGGTVKLNPAHGEPGHDCAKPVGQPLKS
ncbi:MAG: hypothetical protein JWQ96_167 [Segetibacter sp.]|nr:hypothetical protein [Segetibacter sp.]